MLPRKHPQRVAARCECTAKIELCPRFSSCIFDCRFRLLTAQSSWIRVLWGWPIVSCRKPIDWANWCTENRSLMWYNRRERIRRREAQLRFEKSRFAVQLSWIRVVGLLACSLLQNDRLNWAQKTYLCCVIEDRPTIDLWNRLIVLDSSIDWFESVSRLNAMGCRALGIFRVRGTVFARFVDVFNCFRAFRACFSCSEATDSLETRFTVHLVSKCSRIDLFQG